MKSYRQLVIAKREKTSVFFKDKPPVSYPKPSGDPKKNTHEQH